MNNSVSGEIVTRQQSSMKGIPQNTREITFQDSISNMSQTGSILSIKPSPKLVIENFEFNKNYKENITIKNLLSSCIVLKLRSSDSKKLEIAKDIVKISPNKSTTVELNIRVEQKSGQQTKINKIKLYISISSDFGDIKYFVELQIKSDNSPENKNNEENHNINNEAEVINEKLIKINDNEVQEHTSLITTTKIINNPEKVNEVNIDQSKYQIYQHFKSFGHDSNSNVESNVNTNRDEEYIKLESSKGKINLCHAYSESMSEREKEINNDKDLEQDFSPEYVSYKSYSLHKEDENEKNKFANLIISNDLTSNFNHSKLSQSITQEEFKENLIKENKILKSKIENLMVKFKEFENLIKTYAEIIASYESKKCEGCSIKSSFNNRNLQIDFVESFRIFQENDLYPISDINSNFNSRIISENFQFSNYNYEAPIEEKLGLNYNYSHKKYSKSKSIDFLTDNYTKTNYNYLNHNDLPNNPEIDYDNKINLHIKADNYFQIKPEKIRQIYKIHYEEIDNELLNSIKERFIEIQFLNLKENQRRVECLVQLIDIMNNLLFNPKIFLNTLKNEDLKNSSNNVTNSSFFSSHNYSQMNYNFYTEKNLSKLEKLINNLSKILAPICNLEISLSNLENEIAKKISIVSQDPILSNEELELLYKEIQNITLISNELNNIKLENTKFILENNLLTKEIGKKESALEETRMHVKNLEKDIELYKKELSQKNSNANAKEVVLSELQKENQFYKENFIDPEFHESIIKEYEERINLLLKGKNINYEPRIDMNRESNQEDVEELFKLISLKDDEIIELKSQIVIKDNIITNLKSSLDRKYNINNNFIYRD